MSVSLGQRFDAPSGRRYKVATINHGNGKVFMAALDPVSEEDRGLWVKQEALVGDWVERADPPSDGYLMGFEDGVMAQVGNVTSVGSMVTTGGAQPGSWVVPRELFGWPLPDRLCVLAHPGLTENVAMWREGDPGDLPALIVESPNVVVYVKVSESQMPDSADAPDSRVMRGALYRLTGVVS